MASEYDFNQVQDEQVEEHITGEDVSTNLEFLRAAGFLPAFVQPKADKEVAMRGLTEALTNDVSEKMDSFGKRLEALELCPAPEVPDQLTCYPQVTLLRPRRRCEGGKIRHRLERSRHYWRTDLLVLYWTMGTHHVA